MKTKLLAMMLLAGGSMFAQTRFSVGIGFGGHGAGLYQSPPSYASNIPPCPGPDYTWVDGYWSQDDGRDTWVAGYWTRQPFSNVTKLRRALTTASMTTTGEGLRAATNKTETAALTKVEISPGKTAIRREDLTEARRAILGRIKIRIKAAGIATVQMAKTTAKETVTQTDSEAASKSIDG